MLRTNRGVTLVELLVVVVIVGILAAIAIPAYRAHVIRANRADAKTALLAAAGALERCFTRVNSYAVADGCTVTFPSASPENRYTITATTQTAVAFALVATPQAGQAQDTECAAFTLDSANLRGVTGTRPWRDCWNR